MGSQTYTLHVWNISVLSFDSGLTTPGRILLGLPNSDGLQPTSDPSYSDGLPNSDGLQPNLHPQISLLIWTSSNGSVM